MWQNEAAKRAGRTMTAEQVAELLAKLDAETVANVLDQWLSVWDQPEDGGYTDRQAEDVEAIHAALCRLRPDAVELAQSR